VSIFSAFNWQRSVTFSTFICTSRSHTKQWL
jgi:hypothetical protein